MAEVIETINSNSTNPTPAPATPETTPEPKTFSEDYVHALREENKSYRTRGKAYETALKKILNVSDDEELGDIDKRINNFNAANKKALEEANSKVDKYIIEGELNKLLGDAYNEKLTRKLLDFSTIKVEDGKVTGLKEALEAVEKEYPEIRKPKAPNLAGGTGSGKTSTSSEDADLAKFRKALGLTK